MAQNGDSRPLAGFVQLLIAKESVFMQPAAQSSGVIRFGIFEADVRSGELRKSGAKVKIQDLPFRALKLLLSRPNEVLSREQFRLALWPEGVFVDFDHGISSAINRLRDALGDSADNPIFIETVERRGYRWIAPTHHPVPVAPPAAPGPVLVKPEVVKEDAKPQTDRPAVPSHRWGWVLLIPAAALLLALWDFRPVHRSAKAAAKSSTTLRTPDPAPHAANPEAEQFYLKGRFYWEKRTPDGLNRAVDYFTQAIVHDANYAPAYVGLADCYNLLREYTVMPGSEAYPRALAAAQKAVELDDQSSEAHASLAFALFYGVWDSANAEREFRRAIDLDPNNAVAHHWYATYLSTIGRSPESLTEIERAQSLVPASKAILADKGDIMALAGHREEGITLLKQLETTEPDFVSPHRYLKRFYFAAGDYPDFLKEWKQEAYLLHDNSSLKLAETAEKGYATGGTQGMLRNMLALQKKLYDRGLQSPYSLAQTNALLGDRSDALKYLQIAYDTHDELTVQIESDLAFASFHDDPAFQELVTKLGLPARK
jgi:DNA-binding winged helix-turn-helix (wHTH) protein/Tfp pilus assembly protein PilF